MRVAIFLTAACIGGGDGGGGYFIAAFAPPIITPLQQKFSLRLQQLHAEQPNNALLSDLKDLQSKEASSSSSASSLPDYFIADSFNDETTAAAMADELKGINSGGKLMAATAAASTEERTPPKKNKLTPTPPPLIFDPTNPKAMIAIAKAFIATDFGIQEAQSPTVPSYSSSPLSDTNFIWVSGNNINDGRTGILTKNEYLTAGHYFDLRSSFPDLEYRAHDFRVYIDEKREYYGSDDDGVGSDGEVTVRFTTLVTGTFNGGPLQLRSKVMESNGRVMNCPPTSVSITFATDGSEKGKIIKLVTDMVMDRQIGNTHGYSGIAGAAVIAGEEPNDFLNQPPLVLLGRFFTAELPSLDEHYGEEHLPAFPDTVMIQLAKDVVDTNFGLDNPDLLSGKFSYLEPSMGPLNKRKYLEKFSAYGVLDAVRDMDYGIMHYRVDPYNPYRIWVDQRAKGTRTGAIGNAIPKFPAAAYEAAPEAMSISFDDDGYCTRITAAAVLDPLLGNSGGLGGVNGLLYATGTPKTALMTRSLSSFFTRATKSLLSKAGLSSGADSFRTSDGKVVKRLSPFDSDGLPSIVAIASARPRQPAKPYFAGAVLDKPLQQPKPVPPSPTKQIQTAKIIKEPESTASLQAKEKAPIDATPETSSDDASDITDAQIIASSTNLESTSIMKAQELRDKAKEARAEAAEAMERAIALKAQAEEEKKKVIEAKLEEEQRRLQVIEEAKKTLLEAKELKEKERIQRVAEKAKLMKKKAKNVPVKKKGDDVTSGDTSTAFPFSSSPSSSKAGLKGKETPSKMTSSSPKRSPTLNLFNTSAGQSKAASAKPLAKPKSQTPKRSPTLNIFSSAPKVSPTRVKKLSPTPPKATTPKRSPTLNIFSSSPKVPSTKTKKPSPTAPSSRSPTLSIMGVGGAPKSNVAKAASKRKSAVKKPLTKKKAAVLKPSPTTRSRSPTFSLLGIGASPDSKAALEKSSAAKAPATKSPSISLLGVGGKAASDESSTSKAPAKKSPTLSLFGVSGSNQSPSTEKQKPQSPTSTNAFSLFGGAYQGDTSKAATKAISTAPKKLSKRNQVVPKNGEARQVTSKSSNMFGGFFGSSGSGNTKKAVDSSVKNKKKLVAKKAPKGVPVLKGWKMNANNEIQGKVYSSTSFRAGEMITTSPVKGRFQSGNVVITKSGSKYYLE